jgi:thymidylate synthase
LEVGDFVHSFGDLHLYANHVDQAIEQLARAPRPLPRLLINPDRSPGDLTPSDISLAGYDPHPAIKAEVSK